MANDFLTTYTPLANDIAGQTGVNPAVVLGIIDTETGSGQHVVGNNIFGITPPGGVARYPDVQTAAQTFVNLMKTPRYAAVAAAPDPASQAVALVRSGYNTANPNYAQLVAGKALAIGKQLGYQGQDGDATQASSNSPASDYNTPPTAAPAASTPPATSAKGRVLDDPALVAPGGGDGTATPPAQGQQQPPPTTAKDRLLADPALQPGTTDQTKPPAGAPTQEDINAALGADAPPIPASAPTLKDVRSAIQQGDISTLKSLAPTATDNPLARAGKEAVMVGVHGLATLAQMPVNALIGLTQGPSGALTYNPATGAYGLTPEAQTTASFAASPLQFSGANALVREPTVNAPTLGKPPPVTLDELHAAVVRADNAPPTPAQTAAATNAATTAGVPAEHAEWVGSMPARLDQVLQENAAAGGPGSLSAASTPPADAALTPSQVKAYRRVSELGQVLSPIEGEDLNEYVKGSNPTLAERAGDVATSQQESILRERSPQLQEQLQANNTARVNQVDSNLITDVQADDLRTAQREAAERDGAAIAANAGPVDATAMANWAKAKLADPRIQANPEVANTIQKLHDALYDADGNLQTDPRWFWGNHDRLSNMLQKAKDPLNASSNERFSVSQINDFKQLNDAALDQASNGAFRTFLDNQSEFLKQQNAYNLLNNFRYTPGKMLNKDGQILPNNFHKFVADLAMRRGRPGVDPAMDVPDSVMQSLINVDQDLKRASRIDLGKSRGSQTNLFFTLSRALGIGAAHLGTALTGHMHGGLGNVILQQGISQGEQALSRWRLNRLVKQHLAPPERGLTPPPGSYADPTNALNRPP